MRPDLVVVGAPERNDGSGLVQRFEPVVIEALVAELAIEALNVAILHRLAGFNQVMFDAVGLAPANKGTACEFWSIVGSHRLGITSEQGRLVKDVCHVSTAYAVGQCRRTRGSSHRPRSDISGAGH